MDGVTNESTEKTQVPDFEELSRNIASFVEEAGKSTAAYLKPLEKRQANTGFADEVGEIVSHAERVIERVTPINGDRINYQATVSDPLVYTRPWTIAFALNRHKEELLEVACHEDNQDLQHLKDVRDEARAKARTNSTR